ncbi:antibiotic biosynthesis monooxygenase [Spirosoma sp. KNUC1025]|uniref:antibiotic biosynthesis monooxygenase family protein n=1 Tax=Spirosoma sp. KNUC1025 TaxID=2894082 RepID=UPI0038668DE6|nr:hypothetical protein LN737_20685 [Spirosoma sp. KNUC1025]
MIARIWHGWTTPQNADAYEKLLKEEVFKGIAAKQVAGYKGIQLLRREAGEEIEFTTIMWFESIDAVKAFTGKEDYEEAYVPAAARSILSRFDARSVHSNLQYELTYP